MSSTGPIDKLRSLVTDGKNRVNLIILLGVAAMMLILLSDVSCEGSKAEGKVAADTSAGYAEELEQRLERILSSVDGAGETKVMVTLQNGVEYIYASEDSTSNDSSASTDPAGRQNSEEREQKQTSLIIIDTEQGEQALVRTQLMPSVSGVVVVCPGAADPEVAQRILSVVTTALDISPKRVCITRSTQ